MRLFGAHVKWFVDLAEPDATPELLRYVRTVACRAAATALRGPAGPVHINCPYREPLIPLPGPEPATLEQRPGDRPYVAVAHAPRAPDAGLVAALAAELRVARRGLIVCGPQNDPALADALVRLAEALGYPILADPLSGLRRGPHDRALVLDCYDASLRDGDLVERFAPELVLRFGAMPTSKPLLLYLQRHGDCRQILVDGDGGWNEPTLLASDVVHAEPRLLCTALTAELPEPPPDVGTAAWAASWSAADRAAREAIAARLATLDELFEGKVFAELAALLPDGALLYAGNSMPVRDLDTFFAAGDRAVRVLANRGANGIDGVVSSALGAGAAGIGPLVLVIGDLSFYHDSNGLLAAAQHHLNATIILLNNDGGGIFSFLPQAADAEHFETLFGTPHGLDFQPLAQMYGARYTRVAAWGEFRSAVRAGIAEGGLHIVEVPTARDRNVTLHREIWRVVSAALASVSGDRQP